MLTPREQEAMTRACLLAGRGLTSVLPNPVVGCVLLSPAGEVVAEGWHEGGPGHPHAEVVALRQAGERARGATAVVTLEPCDHTGRTGPCSVALLEAGVARVVVGVRDPMPVAAGGADRLRRHGVEVEVVDDPAAEAVNRAWLTAVRRRRPWVTWKLAATLDGRSAAPDRTSRWITGEVARADVHVLRASCDAVLVGSGTVLADDPHLTVRHPDGALAPRQPLRVVVDTRGRTPAHARVRDDAAPTWVATAEQVGAAPGPDGAPRVDLHRLLAELHARQRRRVMLEGGPRLAAAFLDAGLVDEVVAYVAPALLGAGLPALEGTSAQTLGDAVRLEVDDVTRLGDDVRVSGRPRSRSGATEGPTFAP